MSEDRYGILLILLGMSFFSVQDVLIKLIIIESSVFQIMVFRAFFGSVILILFLYFTNREIKFGSHYPVIAIVRGVLFFFGFSLFYISITKITLAEANALFFVNPIFVTILSVLFLKNTIGLHRIGAIIFGLIGTLLIVKPTFTDFNWYMLLPLLTAISYSIGMTLSKFTSDKDNSFQQSFHLYLGSMFFGLLTTFTKEIGFFNPLYEEFQFLNNNWEFTNPSLFMPMILIAITGTIGIFCLVSAYRVGSPQANAPFEYVLLVFSLISGYLVFSEVPDALSFAGIFLIIFSGVYIFIRENINNNLVTSIRNR